MKYYVLLCVALLRLMPSIAQITVTNLTFPSVGDTLRYKTDPNPPALNLGTPGAGAQTWDFSAVSGNAVEEIVYLNATSGNAAASFPNAGMRSENALRETYYKKTATAFEQLGTAGADQLNPGINTTVRYQPALTERRAPVKFFDIKTMETDLSYAIATGELGDSLLGSLGTLVDSFRFRIHTTRLDVVDGWGSCKIPGGTYDVLREKRTETTETSIDVHSLLGWTNLSGLLGGGGSTLLGQIGTDTSVTLYYWSATEKEAIAIADLHPSDESLRFMQYKFIKTTVSTDAPSGQTNKLSLSPNPSKGRVVMQLKDLSAGTMRVKITDLQGKILQDQVVSAGQDTLWIDAGQLPSGTFFCWILDENGQLQDVQKLVRVP